MWFICSHQVDFYTNHDMVEKAFEECDLNHEGELSFGFIVVIELNEQYQ